MLFTRGLSCVARAVAGVRREMEPGEFEVHASYAPRVTPLSRWADALHVEPPHLDDGGWLGWLDGLVAERGIRVVWPQSRIRAALRHPERLAASPARFVLPVEDEETYDLLEDKARFLAAVAEAEPDVPLGHHRVVRTPEDLARARGELEATAPGRRLCIKPSRGIYGAGFRVIDDRRTAFQRWLDNDVFHVGYEELRELLGENHDGRDFLLMEYLAGDERSIDCLAAGGELVTCVVRRKGEGRWQRVEPHAESRRLAARLCRRFRLNGVVNLQTRERLHGDGGREACLLEVNTRMAGGVDIGRAAGVNLPLLALRQAAGTASGPLPVASDTWAGLLEEGVLA